MNIIITPCRARGLLTGRKLIFCRHPTVESNDVLKESVVEVEVKGGYVSASEEREDHSAPLSSVVPCCSHEETITSRHKKAITRDASIV